MLQPAQAFGHREKQSVTAAALEETPTAASGSVLARRREAGETGFLLGGRMTLCPPNGTGVCGSGHVGCKLLSGKSIL